MAKAKSNKGSGVNSAAIEQVSTASLIPYARNARTHSETQVKQIAGSIQEFGFCNPVLIDATNGIIAGHGRVMAAQLLKLETVPCLRLSHLTDAQKRAYVLADNRIALSSGWDEEMLANELSDLHADEFDMALLGFDVDELAGLLKLNEDESAAMPAGEVVEDEVPEAPVDPITKPGNLWILGEHRLLCGDSTKAEDVGRLMAGGKADLLFTSPPYGAGNVAKLRDHYVKGDAKRESFYDSHDDAPEKWLTLMNGWWAAFRSYAELLIVNVQLLADNKRDLLLWAAERRDELVDVVVWDKGHAAPQMQANVLSNCFEFVYLFGGNGSRSIPFSSFHGTMQNVIRVNPKGANENPDKHRAVMPIALPLWAIAELCKRAESVVEPFCGTGTTLIAAEQLNRKCYGMEISPAYCDVIVKRWENLTGKKAVLETA